MVVIFLYNFYYLFKFCMYNFFAVETWQIKQSIIAYFVEVVVGKYSAKIVFLKFRKIHIIQISHFLEIRKIHRKTPALEYYCKIFNKSFLVDTSVLALWKKSIPQGAIFAKSDSDSYSHSIIVQKSYRRNRKIYIIQKSVSYQKWL